MIPTSPSPAAPVTRTECQPPLVVSAQLPDVVIMTVDGERAVDACLLAVSPVVVCSGGDSWTDPAASPHVGTQNDSTSTQPLPPQQQSSGAGIGITDLQRILAGIAQEGVPSGEADLGDQFLEETCMVSPVRISDVDESFIDFVVPGASPDPFLLLLRTV